MSLKQCVVIAGPTGSGKSQLALELANKIDGEIVNIDAIQIYMETPILSCSPSSDDKKSVIHYLYNYTSIREDYSVGKYIKDALAVIRDISASGKIPILVGGTGMYIKSLCYGMHNIPDIDPAIRANSRALLDKLGNEKFYRELQKLDPRGASALHPSNSQRLVRYYEIFMQTGRSIVEFHSEPTPSFLADYDTKLIILEPERDVLYDRCNKRFEHMVENGAIEEVETMRSELCNDGNEGMYNKVIGFSELTSYLDGEISKEEAIILAQTRTRQYAKRQMTWFRHQINNGIRVAFDRVLPPIDQILK